MSKRTLDIQSLKNRASGWYRHNSDNSPDLLNPKKGFFAAYDKDVMDAGLDKLQTQIDELKALVKSYQTDGKAILEDQRKEIYKLEEQLDAVREESAFYRCCALSGEIPKAGAEPSALQGDIETELKSGDQRVQIEVPDEINGEKE